MEYQVKFYSRGFLVYSFSEQADSSEEAILKVLMDGSFSGKMQGLDMVEANIIQEAIS